MNKINLYKRLDKKIVWYPYLAIIQVGVKAMNKNLIVYFCGNNKNIKDIALEVHKMIDSTLFEVMIIQKMIIDVKSRLKMN